MPQLPLAVLDARRSSTSNWGTALEDRYRIGVTLSEADDTLRSHLSWRPAKGWW